jgi:hypothetical protein
VSVSVVAVRPIAFSRQPDAVALYANAGSTIYTCGLRMSSMRWFSSFYRSSAARLERRGSAFGDAKRSVIRFNNTIDQNYKAGLQGSSRMYSVAAGIPACSHERCSRAMSSWLGSKQVMSSNKSGYLHEKQQWIECHRHEHAKICDGDVQAMQERP